MTRKTIEIAVAAITFALLMMSLQAWRAQTKEQSQLRNSLAAQQKLITAANGREAEREQNLKSALGDIATLKKRTQTPSQILRELPKYLPLPQRIVVSRSPAEEIGENVPSQLKKTSTTSRRDTDINPTSSDSRDIHLHPDIRDPNQDRKQSSIELPAQDLDSLFSFVQDCRACDAKLRAAQDKVADEKVKLAVLTRQRDLAVNSAKGGSLAQRLKSRLRWLAAGATIGFLAAYRK